MSRGVGELLALALDAGATLTNLDQTAGSLPGRAGAALEYLHRRADGHPAAFYPADSYPSDVVVIVNR